MKTPNRTRKSLMCAAAIVLLANFAVSVSVMAQSPQAVASQGTQAVAAQSEESRNAEAKAAWEAGEKAGTTGPADVTLIDQAVLKLAAGYFFIPKAEGARIMRALGNTVNEPTFIGLIIGTKQSDEWLVVARYIKEGYVKDDDAKEWNADELMQNLKAGNVEANKDRAARGFPEWEVLDWVERPAYDSVTHRLVWSLLSRQKGEPESAEKGINYNTYALGRDGYISLNLLTTSNRVDGDKGAARELLAALSYNSGKRYGDFNAATDRIAEYGLAALIGGVVAKKFGLLAMAGVFFLKFAKVIGIAAVAFIAGIRKLFGRKPRNAAANT
jgi:uncharacterized membrane-anchored protein